MRSQATEADRSLPTRAVEGSEGAQACSPGASPREGAHPAAHRMAPRPRNPGGALVPRADLPGPYLAPILTCLDVNRGRYATRATRSLYEEDDEEEVDPQPRDPP
jgi:hypothetical protein